MAYSVKKLEKTAIEAIEKHKLVFIEDVLAYIPCSKQTFYNLKMDELDSIKGRLQKNKVDMKVSMRYKWYKSDAPALQIALMKLIATEDEAARLNNSRQQLDVTSQGNKVTPPPWLTPISNDEEKNDVPDNG